MAKINSPEMHTRLRHFRRNPARMAVRFASHLLLRQYTRGTVISGPFKGMRYPIPWPHLPAILGTYELEIRPALNILTKLPFQRIVNIGAADGYYAVGLARLWPNAEIIAYEATTFKHPRIRMVAEANGVADRIRIRGFCTHEELAQDLSRPGLSLLFVDIDGGEIPLLEPACVPALAHAYLLVELHDIIIPGCMETLRRRFEPTHNIEHYVTQERTAESFPIRSLASNALTRPLAVMAMGEQRGGVQDWFLLSPQAPGPQ